MNDACVLPGAGAFEIACAEHLDQFKKTVKGKVRAGAEVETAAVSRGCLEYA